MRVDSSRMSLVATLEYFNIIHKFSTNPIDAKLQASRNVGTSRQTTRTASSDDEYGGVWLGSDARVCP